MATFASLYADGAFWQQNPFRDPEPGYLVRVFDEEQSADCAFGAPIVDGDRAAVRWSATTKLVDAVHDVRRRRRSRSGPQPAGQFVAVGGEPGVSAALRDRIDKELGWVAVVPAFGERVRLD
jgi:hypothetical protein